ncbi:hypothetical protein PZN02_006239 (plasmid) [Sinorhizobium garamanticum]|uniref:Uncharacterized protein n=1 Tax=Sinorhizobium garamanticum TaxID=680247 RepID=A0ABY8DKM1_9HYPH|nr:hypothetical protein [Sinorhizobium garamanticum]WEX91454.1 hypothetical protein PZN02_006239 [Sinorhizobium garamanticum]
MADFAKMKRLIRDCQKDIAEYLPPESDITEHQVVQRLINRLEGPQNLRCRSAGSRALSRMAYPAASVLSQACSRLGLLTTLM